MTYGKCENTFTAYTENLLPIGLAQGRPLKNDISKKQGSIFDDFFIPEVRLCDQL